MGASPTPMAFGEVYTSLQTGVIDGYEHDASTTLQQRFYEVARYMARTRHIAGVLGLFASTTGLARLPADIRARVEQRRARGRRRHSGRWARAEDIDASRELTARGMTIRDIDGAPFRRPAERLWERRSARARRRPLARRRSASDGVTVERATAPRTLPIAPCEWSIAFLVVAQAVVVGLQVVGRHVLRAADSVDRGNRAAAARAG